jgi:hypothetical protein
MTETEKTLTAAQLRQELARYHQELIAAGDYDPHQPQRRDAR